MASKIANLTVKEFFANKAAPKIVAVCGSQRIGSFNKMIHGYAVDVMKSHGADVTPVDLAALQLPLYNPELEAEGFPAAAQEFKNLLSESDGIFVATPEYNGFTSPLLLNSITWATRGDGDMYAGFKGKMATVMAASPGPAGGLRMIRSLNQMFQDMGSIVVPGANAIGSAYKVFGKDGTIQDDVTKSKIETTAGTLVHFCRFQANREYDCEIHHELQNLGEYGSVDLPDSK